ncbi:LPXTG cell wall anchor domain-containing protein [Streptomyces montanus]|uniref:LPXTG cell wall anchor domain-containing protein n=1 Tax=Streptomyces montanus TaxID=2580423 RepID=A0A5R9FIM2_9ACTN|nr:LPXTG cell wall anchor domain-containing protein [Streptomyces montanus]TLS40434.1 LPXTG cell wall anchor domain-containing protein [Streptomyces montanus]
MRTLFRAGALAAAAAATLLTAPAAHAAPQGDNGTVKIHDAVTGEDLRKNEPHVCTFYLDAFGFDGGQRIAWHIEAWAPTADVKGETVTSGSLTLDAEGHARTNDMSLPDGHYKLFWNFDGEKGSAKHKVFWTDCEGGPGDSDDEGGVTPSPSPSASTAVAGGVLGESPSASPAPSAQGGDSGDNDKSGDLAETGSSAPVGILSAVAAALVAVGGYLLFRRHKVGGRS